MSRHEFLSRAEELQVKQYAFQQAALKQNVRTVESDLAWNQLQSELGTSCGAVIFCRRFSCASSRYIAAHLYELSRESVGSANDPRTSEIIFAEVDIEKCQAAAKTLNIQLTPTFVTWQHGALLDHLYGVSKMALTEIVNTLCLRVDRCNDCGRHQRLLFMEDLERVLDYGVQDDTVPVGLCPLQDKLEPYDQHAQPGPAKFRIEHLQSLLSGHPLNGGGLHGFLNSYDVDLVTTFLSDIRDTGLSLSDLREKVDEWLLQQGVGDHPSLWSDKTFQTRAQIVKAATLRRCARVELWVLNHLSNRRVCTATSEASDSKLRVNLNQRLQDVCHSAWTCGCKCESCGLTCARSRGHGGAHDCRTDHQCHYQGNHGLCEGCAGHEGLHMLPRPPPPPPPPPVPDAPRRCSTSFVALRPAWPGIRNSADEGCSICLEPMDTICTSRTSGIKELPCRHAFHVHCVTAWLKVRHWCPNCRAATLVSELRDLVADETPRPNQSQSTAADDISQSSHAQSVAILPPIAPSSSRGPAPVQGQLSSGALRNGTASPQASTPTQREARARPKANATVQRRARHGRTSRGASAGL